MAHKVVVIYGSVREGRKGLPVARHAVKAIEAAGAEVSFYDPMDLELPLFVDYLQTLEKKGRLNETQQRFANDVRAADAVVFVSAEYNHSIPPALKNIIDYLSSMLFYKAAGIVTYSMGGYGGARASMQLRMSLGALTVTLPSMLNVPAMDKAFEEDGTVINDTVKTNSEKFVKELMWWTDAIAAKKAKDGTPQ